ncbi:MAG TPA: response regulator [Nitrospiraceae bacterium]|nr:response regulator [Nitrospiraceae bacterium]
MPTPIFVVDSSPAVRRMIEQISSPQGYEVVGFQDGPAALEAARRMTPALIIADYHLANMTFSGFCKEVTKLDHLTETILVSVVPASGRVDEEHLRSLGVRVFLKKPLQAEELLATINGLKNGVLHKRASTLKKRTWPPDSTATDLELGTEESADNDPLSSSEPDTLLKEQPHMTPATTVQAAAARPAPTSERSCSEAAAGEEALRALLDYLLRSVVREVEDKITELIPAAVVKELALHVTNAVREEAQKQLASALSADRIEAAVHGIVTTELSKHMASQSAALERAITQHVDDIAPALVERTGERLIRQLIDPGLEKHVPQAVRAHLGPVDSVIRQEVREAVAAHAEQRIEEIVRELAGERIHETVQRIVPDIAEAQVKDEIRRLTAPD